MKWIHHAIVLVILYKEKKKITFQDFIGQILFIYSDTVIVIFDSDIQ